MSKIKKMLFLAAGGCWLLFGVGFGSLLLPFFLGGAGRQWFGGTLEFLMPASSGTVLMGLVYVVGLATASLICFAVSFGLFERGLAAPEAHEKSDLP